MLGNQPMLITEWEWFKLQLNLYTLQEKAQANYIGFQFDDTTSKVTCSIWREMVEELLGEGASEPRQLEFYRSWVEGARYYIARILQTIPNLSHEFNLQTDMCFEIMHDYGMGSIVVCEFRADQIIWKLPVAATV